MTSTERQRRFVEKLRASPPSPEHICIRVVGFERRALDDFADKWRTTPEKAAARLLREGIDALIPKSR
ncbi:MAG: hypothetical protein LJE69_20605 [Thiohalocapsa sp.]|jgi:hypothetical protein|uniref:hypothetical protein n=1 Tax=Thiohalocapsa sp. TaxID=2497641 RepID=UPI0025E4724A|nr:hypothetical protein [Thiohalocapsa sp.]MCG6943639.1 hypothetical protein [Thiohalocapsa sp.]